MDTMLFPFSEYWWFYAGFTAFVLVMLAVDLGVFHRKVHEVSIREATVWTAVWIALALAFNYLLYAYASWRFSHSERLLAIPGFDPQAAARQVGLEFLAGYIVEKSLSIDNLFVFVLIFAYFAVPAIYQHRVLFYGIVGALVSRAIFIGLGSVLLQYHAIVILFGAFLIFTGIKMVVVKDQKVDPDSNLLVRLVRRIFPVAKDYTGKRFFMTENGRRAITPLFITLVFVEATDIIFAVDSVPAIFALTKEPLIVFTSNIFAILGLRAKYFVLAGAVSKFHLLRYGLAAVLAFVGLKMVWLNGQFDGKFPIHISLGVIALLVGVSIILSLLFPKRDPSLKQQPDV